MSALTPATPSAPPPTSAPSRPVPLWQRPIAGHALFFAGLVLCVAYFFTLGPQTSEAKVRVENAIQHFSGTITDAAAAYRELSDAFASYNRLRSWETVVMILSVALMGIGRLLQAVGARRA